jgi:hypothetical protein
MENGKFCIEITNIDKCNLKKLEHSWKETGFGFNEHQIRDSKKN